MTGRGFCVKVELDLHAITCPGVWLCPNGKIALRIDSLESYLESTRVDPVFPLLFHNKFIFQKLFTGINTLIELQHCLEGEPFYAELLQWSTRKSGGVVLATFRTNLAEILYPAPCYKGLLSGIDVDLLMDTEKAFPGILAPKIEVSTKTTVEEMAGIFGSKNLSDIRQINPKVISSKTHSCSRKSHSSKGNIRQRKVCHSQGMALMSHPRDLIYRPSDYTTPPPTVSEKCYHTVGITPSYNKFITKESTHCPNISKECSICSKYRHYFSDHFYEGHSGCMRNSAKSINTLKSRDFKCTSEESLVSKDEQACPSQPVDICKEGHNFDFPVAKTTYGNDQEFYKNLEKFYKRMYKHAKLRAQEGGDCV